MARGGRAVGPAQYRDGLISVGGSVLGRGPSAKLRWQGVRRAGIALIRPDKIGYKHAKVAYPGNKNP